MGSLSRIGQHLGVDLHFASLYVLASAKQYCLEEYKRYSYAYVVSVHSGWSQEYFANNEEIEEVSRALLEKIRNQPEFAYSLIDQIRADADELNKFVDQFLRRIAHFDVEIAYLQMISLQKNIYKYARILENLDRGNLYFTSYLREVVKRECGPSSNAELNSLFADLTQGEEPSPFARAEGEFGMLAEQVASQAGVPSLMQANSMRNIEMMLSPKLLRALDEYVFNWGHLDYHGIFGQPCSSLLRR